MNGFERSETKRDALRPETARILRAHERAIRACMSDPRDPTTWDMAQMSAACSWARDELTRLSAAYDAKAAADRAARRFRREYGPMPTIIP